MRIFRDASIFSADYYGSVMALGNFDGLHIGHQAIIDEAVRIARRTGKPASVLTFEPHPRHIFYPGLPSARIISFQERARLLRSKGIDFIRVIHFTRAFSQTSAEQFVSQVLVGQLHVSHVVTGSDFSFGHKREGNVSYLKTVAKSYNFGVTAPALIAEGNQIYSSTRIRELLAEGKVQEAAKLLTRPYTISGRVVSGDKRGRQLGFPTANIIPHGIVMPSYGVYAVTARIRGEEVGGVANIGIRPTFNGEEARLEVHLFDWHEDIYGEYVSVTFIERIREEKKFNGIDALKMQIADDCKAARNIINSYNLL